MVRKTTAVEINSTSTKKPKTNSPDDFDIEKFFQESREWVKENSHLLIGVIALLRWLIVLKEFLFGMILVTSGILFISWFFKK